MTRMLLFLILSILLFLENLVQAAESDCLRTSFPRLIGDTTGNTVVNVIILKSTTAEDPGIYIGGSSSAPKLSKESTNSYTRPIIMLTSTKGSTSYSKVLGSYDGTYKYTSVTAMRLSGSYLYAVLQPESSSQPNLIIKILASNGKVITSGNPYAQLQTGTYDPITNQQFLVVSYSSKTWFITGSRDSSNQLRFQTHTDSTATTEYDSGIGRWRYYYERVHNLYITQTDTTFQKIHALTWDSTNSKVYASLTFKGNHDLNDYYSTAIVTFSYNLATVQTMAIAETTVAGNNYFAPSILTVSSGDRMIGFGTEFSTGTTNQVNDQYERIFIEKTAGAADEFFFFKIDTFRTRELSYLDYDRSGSTVTMVVHDAADGLLYFHKITYAASSPYTAADFTINYQEQVIGSYCSANSGGCTTKAVAWGTGKVKGVSQEQFFYAGSKQNHFTTYSYQVGFVTVRTDSEMQCWDTQWSADDTLTYVTTYGGSNPTFSSTLTYGSDVWNTMTTNANSPFTYAFGYEADKNVKAVERSSNSNELAAYDNQASSNCYPWQDDYFYPSTYATNAVTNSYLKHFDGKDDALSITLRSTVFKSILAQQGCGQRTVTYSWVKKSGNIPATEVITFDNSNEGKISTDKITMVKMNNLNTATHVYDVTYTVSASADPTYQTGTNVATRTIEFTLTLTYLCYKLASPTPTITPSFSTNQYLWTEYFDDSASSKLTKVFLDDYSAYTLNDHCTVDTWTLYESDCTTAVINTANFQQLTGTVSGQAPTFEMNIDPVSLYDYTLCLKTDNGHEFTNTRNFKVRVICGDNNQYTVAAPTTLDSTARTLEKYIDTTGHTFTWDEFTSTGDRLCPIANYKVYSNAVNSNSYNGYSGFTVSSTGLDKTVTISDAVFASNLNTYQFYLRGEFDGGGYAFSDVVQYKVVCGTETLSLATTTSGSSTVDQSTSFYSDQGWKYLSSLNTADLFDTIDNSAYSSHFLTDKSANCPVDEWELWEDDGTFQWNSGSLSKITSANSASRIQINGYDQTKTYQLTVALDNGAATKQNYYNKYILRGFTKSRHNSLIPITKQIDYWVYVDICGWETVIEPTTGSPTLIKPTMTYYVEVGLNRSITESFSQYTTDSTTWPTWHSSTGPQCDITNYDLTTDTSNHVSYPPQLNTEATYYRQLRTWDEPTRTYTIDTADNTTKLGTETFYVRMKTRGTRYYYYPIQTTLVCGQEKVYTPEDVKIFTVPQNSSWEGLSYTTKGFYSDMPHNCNITKFTIEKVVDEFNRNVSQETIGTKFQISNTGNFTLLDASEIFNHYIIYISAETALIKSSTIHTLNVTVVPFFSINTNSPPVFDNTTGFNLPNQLVYIGLDYSSKPYKLPDIIDPDGNSWYVMLEQGRERTFAEYDNSTRQFNFMQGKIPENLRGVYRVKVQIGDDNWLGPLINNYTLLFVVTDEPVPTIIKAEEDISSKGAKVQSMGVTGSVNVGFEEPCYLNIEKLKKRRLLESQPEDGKPWIIYEEAETLPPIPEDLTALTFPKELIDDRVFDVYVDPSPNQDISKVNLTWVVDKLSAEVISFQVFYDHPEYISQEGLDTLVIKIKDRRIFLSQKDGKQIFNNGFEIRERIRKQLPSSSAKEAEVEVEDVSVENLQMFIDSELYEQSIRDAEAYSKISIIGILVFCFLTGSKNLDFLWSYLGVLQIFSHLSLIRIQTPMNVILLTKSLLSISVFDFREIQAKVSELSPINMQEYFGDYIDKIIAIMDPPGSDSGQRDVNTEISQYQFFEHGYRETDSFFQNLRSTQVLVIIVAVFFVLAPSLYFIGKIVPPLGQHWFYKGLWIRCWNYMGPNALIRILLLEFILVLFAGFTVFRKELFLLATGEFDPSTLTTEMYVLASALGVPLLLSLIIPCCSKEGLRKPYIEISMNTLYYKSNLRDCMSKTYPLLLLFQRLAVAAVVFFIEEIAVQLEVLVLVNLFISWMLTSVDYSYLDKHLKTFERWNQGFLSVVQISLLLFTDFVQDRQVQFNYGYLYSGLILFYNAIGLGLSIMYALEPFTTWVRMRWMRKEQIRLAVQLRAQLIKEAKERKEARKQKKLASFNNFSIDLGYGAQTDRDGAEHQETDQGIEEYKKDPGMTAPPTRELDSIKEEQFEDTLNESLKLKEGALEEELEQMFKQLDQKDKEMFGMDTGFGRAENDTMGNEDSEEFDEAPFAEILDKMSLMDRARYVEILKRSKKLKKMREQLVFADLDDDGADRSKSKKMAKDINKMHDNLLGKKEVKQHRNLIEEEAKTTNEEESKNPEYWAMINAIDKELTDLEQEMRSLERISGFNRTGDTWRPVEENEPDRVNILDVFAVELEN